MKPVASKREINRLVKHYVDLLGFSRPWRLAVVFHDSRDKDFCYPKEPGVYACAESEPQYHRAWVHIDPYHEGWGKEDGQLEECIRHELFHVFLSAYTHAADHAVGNRTVRGILEDLEDELVNRLATMPVWGNL